MTDTTSPYVCGRPIEHLVMNPSYFCFRLACGLGGKTVFPHILNTTPQMMQNPDWKCRHGALMAISAAGEGCHKQMESYLPQIMDAVMNFINDPVSPSFIDA